LKNLLAGAISFTIEKATYSAVNDIIEKTNEFEDKEEQGDLIEF
jgi:hypothetical protein